MKKYTLSLLALSALASTSHGALVAHYNFDEGSGTTVADSSGNGRDLTLVCGSWNATGQFGGSVNLGGALARTGGVSSATVASLNTVTGNKVTISFWANLDSENVGSNPFYISDSNSGQGNRILSSHLEWSDGTTYWDAAYNISTSNRLSIDLGSVSDTRHHYLYTYDGDNGDMEIFKDNVSVASGSAGPGGNINWADIRNFELGALSFNNGLWSGEMDDFAIWNEVLDETARNNVFNNGVGFTPEPSSALLLGLGGFGLMMRRRR